MNGLVKTFICSVVLDRIMQTKFRQIAHLAKTKNVTDGPRTTT